MGWPKSWIIFFSGISRDLHSTVGGQGAEGGPHFWNCQQSLEHGFPSSMVFPQARFSLERERAGGGAEMGEK